VRNAAFAELLSHLITSAGVSGRTVATNIQVDTAQLSRWRHGAVPRPQQIVRLAEYFGVDAGELMAVAYPMGKSVSREQQAQARVSAWRQSVHEQLERWISAVGPQYEEFFWRYLKSQGDSTVAMLRDLGIAVNPPLDGAVKHVVKPTGKPTSTRRRRGGGALRASYRTASAALAARYGNLNVFVAA
jgi:transcriptional regulator with XRE-family HTH domain